MHNSEPVSSQAAGHPRWVRICHWLTAAAFITLAVSGFFILMVHPRLYLGHVGNDLTPALLSLPISNNYRPDELHSRIVFTELPGAPVSAERNFEIFNQNGWARSLHFLAAWGLVLVGAIYAAIGIVGGHVRRDLIPRGSGQRYKLLQKLVYTSVMFVLLPLMVATGLTMAPAVTAAYPFLLDLFGGYQTARTIHFFAFTALVVFLLVHVAMVIATGFGRQLRKMTWGT
jgi:thiosulfate reductase cytochrome b subunit